MTLAAMRGTESDHPPPDDVVRERERSEAFLHPSSDLPLWTSRTGRDGSGATASGDS